MRGILANDIQVGSRTACVVRKQNGIQPDKGTMNGQRAVVVCNWSSALRGCFSCDYQGDSQYHKQLQKLMKFSGTEREHGSLPFLKYRLEKRESMCESLCPA